MRSKRDLLLNFFTAAFTIGAAVVVWRRFHQPPPRTAAMTPPTHVTDWKSFAVNGHRQGPADARVTLTVFSDYQCPYCKAFAADIKRIEAKWPRDVAVIIRHFPLQFHSHARAAALAAECAGAQGKFNEYHDLLFANQDSLSARTWHGLAESARVPDLVAFDACTTNQALLLSIARDSAEAARLGVEGTPTFLLNDLKYVGNPGFDSLDAYIAREMRSTNPGVQR